MSHSRAQRARMRAANQERNTAVLGAARLTPGPFCACSLEAENQIDYIEVPVTDMAGTKKFYAAVFGWTFEDYGPDYASFFDGRLAGGFTMERLVPSKGLLLVIYASDLAATQEKIKTAGGAIVKDTFSFPGGRRFHFVDPNGNELAVWSDAAQ